VKRPDIQESDNKVKANYSSVRQARKQVLRKNVDSNCQLYLLDVVKLTADDILYVVM
jgi:hypothetical protein